MAKIAKLDFIDKFYLAGGTALAVQIGHRESVDLDFFSYTKFSVHKLKQELSIAGILAVDYEDEDTLVGMLDDVKISFFHYSYEQSYVLVKFEDIFLASEQDIAAMKLDTISARGSKKDFVDIYFLLKKYSLNQLVEFFENKYKNIQYNKLHILKSLVYFDDANGDPDPLMLVDFDWNETKSFIEKIVKQYCA
ncbi:MAG: nucleotidyl transferase AbiEii/AbiGii toxin family protein [Candidatus Moraniibacteriota bacterium]